MTHLTREELLEWRDAPDESGRGRIVSHLAACDDCASVYADLVRTRPVDAAASPAFDSRAFVERGYGARAGAPLRVRIFRPGLLVPLAAAAALLVAVWLPRDASEPVRSDTAAVRGSRLEAVAPVGDSPHAFAFRWTSPFSGVRYRVEVTDADGVPVASRETREEQLALDTEMEAGLRAGTRYRWTVSALDASGDVIARSEPREFTRGVRSR